MNYQQFSELNEDERERLALAMTEQERDEMGISTRGEPSLAAAMRHGSRMGVPAVVELQWPTVPVSDGVFIKIEHAHHVVMVPDTGLVGDVKQAYCDGAGAALAAVVAQGVAPQWISVEDELPNTYVEGEPYYTNDVFVCLNDGRIEKGFYCDDGNWWLVGSSERITVTHWVPLLELPEVPK